jgi:hypothetical protein
MNIRTRVIYMAKVLHSFLPSFLLFSFPFSFQQFVQFLNDRLLRFFLQRRTKRRASGDPCEKWWFQVHKNRINSIKNVCGYEGEEEEEEEENNMFTTTTTTTTVQQTM